MANKDEIKDACPYCEIANTSYDNYNCFACNCSIAHYFQEKAKQALEEE